MVERLISFVDPEAGVYGAVALGGDGAASACLAGADGALTIADGLAARGEGVLRVTGAMRAESGTEGECSLILGLAARTSQLAFETGPDREVRLQAIGSSGEIEGSSGGVPTGFEGSGVAWQISGEADQSALRSAWAMLEDRSLLALFALRPAGEEHHGHETVGAARIASDGAVTSYAEPLLSTEYDKAGSQVRATLELWGDEDGGLATRGAGTRVAGGRAALGEGELEAARFQWQLDGEAGFGGYEIFRAAS